jgi:uncharacterized protein (DUF305 family)
MKLIAGLAAAARIAAAPAMAQQPKGGPMPKGGMEHGQMMQGDHSMHGGPAGREYMDVMHRMNQQMMQVNDRDPGRAFALMMIPHHQGAIDSARVVLKHTKDAELRRMAEKSIEDQQKEIAELRSWLERHGGLPAAAR